MGRRGEPSLPGFGCRFAAVTRQRKIVLGIGAPEIADTSGIPDVPDEPEAASN